MAETRQKPIGNATASAEMVSDANLKTVPEINHKNEERACHCHGCTTGRAHLKTDPRQQVVKPEGKLKEFQNTHEKMTHRLCPTVMVANEFLLCCPFQNGTHLCEPGSACQKVERILTKYKHGTILHNVQQDLPRMRGFETLDEIRQRFDVEFPPQLEDQTRWDT